MTLGNLVGGDTLRVEFETALCGMRPVISSNQEDQLTVFCRQVSQSVRISVDHPVAGSGGQEVMFPCSSAGGNCVRSAQF